MQAWVCEALFLRPFFQNRDLLNQFYHFTYLHWTGFICTMTSFSWTVSRRKLLCHRIFHLGFGNSGELFSQKKNPWGRPFSLLVCSIIPYVVGNGITHTLNVWLNQDLITNFLLRSLSGFSYNKFWLFHASVVGLFNWFHRIAHSLNRTLEVTMKLGLLLLLSNQRLICKYALSRLGRYL